MIIATRWSFISTLICLSLILSVDVSFADNTSCGKDDRLCGPNCMLSICQKLGVKANINELTTLCRYDEENGTSLAGLYDAAKAKGLEAVGMKISGEELASVKCPAIAHLWDNHFVVVEVESSDKLKVTNPPAEPKVVTVEDFKKAYSGFALLIAKDKSLFPKPEATKGADLRVDAYSWDFGTVEDQEPLRQMFTIRNEGNEDLLIDKVDSSCGCTASWLSQATVPPGEKAEVMAIFDPADRKGAQSQALYIHSNDPVTPVVHLQISGVVQPSRLLFSPRSVSLGEVKRGENISREIFLPQNEVHPFEIEKASSDKPFITTAIASRIDKSGYIIKLDIQPEKAPIGEFKGVVTIQTNHQKDPKIEKRDKERLHQRRGHNHPHQQP